MDTGGGEYGVATVSYTHLDVYKRQVMEWFITAIDSGNYFDLSQLRLMGVMQRLGICYGITALLLSLIHI